MLPFFTTGGKCQIKTNERFFFFPNFFAKREKGEGYGVDASDGGMRGGGFGNKKAANRRGHMKRSG